MFTIAEQPGAVKFPINRRSLQMGARFLHADLVVLNQRQKNVVKSLQLLSAVFVAPYITVRDDSFHAVDGHPDVVACWVNRRVCAFCVLPIPDEDVLLRRLSLSVSKAFHRVR